MNFSRYLIKYAMITNNQKIFLILLFSLTLVFLFIFTNSRNNQEKIDTSLIYQIIQNATKCPICSNITFINNNNINTDKSIEDKKMIRKNSSEDIFMQRINDPPKIIQKCSNDTNVNNLIKTAYNRKYIGCNFWATGGIGNQIWRFASLYGLARYTRREPFFEAKNYDQMNNLLELNLIFPMMGEVLAIKSPPEIFLKKYHFADDCCKFDNPKKLLSIPDKYVKIAGDYLQSFKFFHEFRDEIRQIFECGLTVKLSVDNFAKNLFKNDKNHKLCAHIRRGDFIGDIMLESKEDFVVPALKYAFDSIKLDTNNDNISMLFIGNDHEFIKKLPLDDIGFKNIYIPDELSRGEDMCLGINYCDSMVMTASGSTFGWWISYLMKPGSKIFYNSQITDNSDFSKDIHDFDIFPPDWIMLTVENNIARKENKWWHQRRNQNADLPSNILEPWI